MCTHGSINLLKIPLHCTKFDRKETAFYKTLQTRPKGEVKLLRHHCTTLSLCSSSSFDIFGASMSKTYLSGDRFRNRLRSHCSQIFSVDFLEFLLKRRHLKNLKKSANKFRKNKNDKKEIIDSNIDF